MHATIESLLSNIDRSCTEGLIDKQGTCNSLSNQLSHAPLHAFVNHVEAQRGKSVDVANGQPADRVRAGPGRAQLTPSTQPKGARPL